MKEAEWYWHKKCKKQEARGRICAVERCVNMSAVFWNVAYTLSDRLADILKHRHVCAADERKAGLFGGRRYLFCILDPFAVLSPAIQKNKRG